ncbi:hypothetical protein [Polyangium aurulentum]|uniref:hypothetical protein n=1 Tax=Polyangium aurulentum TaxID=2567896 RepID=UPI00146B5602|nr:hypothetical protein [Polyangium aurulentum]UQA54947.1 hypothetical protein E8A73_026690 [Polyangium aurulentum]
MILTKAQHEEITKTLAAETKTATSVEALWKGYKKASRDYPHWLAAIKSYFPDAK